MQLRFRVNHSHARGALSFQLLARLTLAHRPTFVLLVFAQKPGAGMDVVETPIILQSALAAETRRHHNHPALHACLGGDEILDVIADVLLDCGGWLQMRADFRVNLVPRATDI